MTWILTVILVGAMISWAVTLKYQHEVVELKKELQSKDSEHMLEMHLLSKEYDNQNKKVIAENDRLRRYIK